MRGTTFQLDKSFYFQCFFCNRPFKCQNTVVSVRNLKSSHIFLGKQYFQAVWLTHSLRAFKRSNIFFLRLNGIYSYINDRGFWTIKTFWYGLRNQRNSAIYFIFTACTPYGTSLKNKKDEICKIINEMDSLFPFWRYSKFH